MYMITSRLVCAICVQGEGSALVKRSLGVTLQWLNSEWPFGDTWFVFTLFACLVSRARHCPTSLSPRAALALPSVSPTWQNVF